MSSRKATSLVVRLLCNEGRQSCIIGARPCGEEEGETLKRDLALLRRDIEMAEPERTTTQQRRLQDGTASIAAERPPVVSTQSG